MTIWKKPTSCESINKFNKDTLVENLGIHISNLGPDYLEAIMPVDHRTVQPYRLLHGGASCALAESLGSIAANLTLESIEQVAVGQHIEATHIKSATSGSVRGLAKAIHLGRSSQTWRIEIFNDENQLICDAKIIMAIIKKK